MSRILIVEDEPKVAGFIKNGLIENQFEAEVAYDGLSGKKLAFTNSFDLIILDINLPYINGLELCKIIRNEEIDIPIIMLTAFSTTDDKIVGLDSGADDYLTKPFEFRELLARVRALLKRGKTFRANEVLKIADLELDCDAKTVIRSGHKIDLTAKEFMLLEYLLRNKGRVISRADIAEKVWDITFDTGTNVIDVYVNFLRKKIDREHPEKLIHTVVGMGYMLKEE